MRFEAQVRFLNEPKSQDFFPKKFSNEIYWSTIDTAEDIEYDSCFSVKFSLTSHESYVVNGKRKTLKPQTFLIVNDGSRVISERTVKSGGALSLFIDPELISEVMQSTESGCSLDATSSVPQPVFFPEEIIRDNSPFLTYLNNMSHRLRLGLAQELSESFYFELAEQLLASHAFLNTRFDRIRASKYSTRVEIYKRTNLAKQFIEDNYSRKLNLKTMAGMAAMSQYHFSRCFKDIYGLTPQQYHSRVRIEKSKELLQRKFEIYEIADLLGYPDIPTFSKKFKSFTGVSPGHYKN